MTHSTPPTYYSVEEACEKQLRDHELPSTIEGFLIVTESFSYLVDDLAWDQGNGKQPSVLLLNANIADALGQYDELSECFGGVALYQEWVEVTGILRASGIGAFERQLYRIDSLSVLIEEEDESVSKFSIELN
ncbi:MAG: hypothetical protein V7765_06825 [Oleispira sp.]